MKMKRKTQVSRETAAKEGNENFLDMKRGFSVLYMKYTCSFLD